MDVNSFGHHPQTEFVLIEFILVTHFEWEVERRIILSSYRYHN